MVSINLNNWKKRERRNFWCRGML